MVGVIPNKVYNLLVRPRADGGKLFFYEVASLIRQSKAGALKRSPASMGAHQKLKKEEGPKKGPQQLSTKDIQDLERALKVGPLEASKRELERLLNQFEFLKRHRPFN